MYLEGVETKFNRAERNEDPVQNGPMPSLSVFQSCCCPIGKKNIVHLDDHLREKAHWYILNNCPEIQTYLK